MAPPDRASAPPGREAAAPAAPAGSAPATLAGVSAIGLWSFSGLCYAVGGRALGALPFLCLASAIGVLAIVLLEAARGRPVRGLFRLPGRVVIAGFFGIVVYSLLLGPAMGMAHERDLAHVMLLNYLWPIWIVLLSLALLPHPPGGRAPRVLAGAALGFAGILIARGPEVLRYPASALAPHAMAAAGGFLWALYSVLLRRWELPPERGGSTLQFALLALASGLLAALDGSWRTAAAAASDLDAGGIAFTVFAGVGPFGLGYFWWEIGMKRGAVHTLAVLSYLIPLASAVLIGLTFRQAMGPLLIPGAALIALGAWVSQGGAGAGRAVHACTTGAPRGYDVPAARGRA